MWDVEIRKKSRILGEVSLFSPNNEIESLKIILSFLTLRQIKAAFDAYRLDPHCMK